MLQSCTGESCRRFTRAILVVVLLLSSSMGSVAADPRGRGVCQGDAPREIECTDTFISSSTDLALIVHLVDFLGILRVDLTSASARREMTCGYGGVYGHCLLRGSGEFLKGQDVSLTVSSPGQGHWRVVAKAATDPEGSGAVRHL